MDRSTLNLLVNRTGTLDPRLGWMAKNQFGYGYQIQNYNDGIRKKNEIRERGQHEEAIGVGVYIVSFSFSFFFYSPGGLIVCIILLSFHFIIHFFYFSFCFALPLPLLSAVFATFLASSVFLRLFS